MRDPNIRSWERVVVALSVRLVSRTLNFPGRGNSTDARVFFARNWQADIQSIRGRKRLLYVLSRPIDAIALQFEFSVPKEHRLQGIGPLSYALARALSKLANVANAAERSLLRGSS